MCFTRRAFLKSGALAIIGTAAIPSFLTRAVFADTTGGKRKRLVVIFQRGAADGLNIVVPYAEPQYYKLRPSLAVPPPGMANGNGALDLDGFFALHPAMASFQPLWRDKHLAIVHAVGSPDNTRSHFDAQDYMESGTPGFKSTDDGWLNRAVRPQADLKQNNETPFRAVAMGTSLPRILAGPAPAVAINNINEFGVAGRTAAAGMLTSTFESMYADSVDTVLHGTARETFDAVKMLKAADPSKYTPAPNAKYPRGRLGDSLRQLAQLMKADLGVEVAFADIGGWDHHVNEAPQINNVLRDLSQSISAFWYDLGPLAEETVIVTMSEFGRTARENGNRGTDHGHANVMFVLGGPVRGGRVYGKWPGLEQHQLYEARDLALTTDFRTVMSEAVTRQIGVKDTHSVFPGFTMPSPLHLIG
jgi:uncharacterized protein (DUF1501 family)